MDLQCPHQGARNLIKLFFPLVNSAKLLSVSSAAPAALAVDRSDRPTRAFRKNRYIFFRASDVFDLYVAVSKVVLVGRESLRCCFLLLRVARAQLPFDRASQIDVWPPTKT